MYNKSVLFALLGVAPILAVFAASVSSDQYASLTRIELKAKYNLSKIFYTFLKNVMDPANRIPATAGVHYEHLMKMFVELKSQVSVELEELQKELQEYVNEAKKYDGAMYEEIKYQSDEIFQRISFEYKDQIHKLELKLTDEINENNRQQSVQR